MQGCDLVFVDPDNGVRLESCGTRSVSPEHIYKDELLAFADSAGVAVAYLTPHGTERTSPMTTRSKRSA